MESINALDFDSALKRLKAIEDTTPTALIVKRLQVVSPNQEVVVPIKIPVDIANPFNGDFRWVLVKAFCPDPDDAITFRSSSKLSDLLINLYEAFSENVEISVFNDHNERREWLKGQMLD